MIYVFIVTGAFLQGFFFEIQYLTFGILMLISTLLSFWRRPIQPGNRLLLVSVVLLFVVYLLATDFQFSLQDASVTLKMFLLIPLYLLAVQLDAAQWVRVWKWFVNAVIGASALGLLFALFRDARFEGLMEYANTAALLLLLALLIQLPRGSLWISYFLSFSIVLTQSRAVFVLSLVAVAVTLFLLKRWAAASGGSRQMVIVCLGMLSGLLFLYDVKWFVALLIGSIVLMLLADQVKPVVFGRTLLALPVAALALLMLMPQFSFTRLQSLGLGSSEWQTRLTYYQDALTMIARQPLGGYGADGWSGLQHLYQSAGYQVKYVHNHLLQTAVDAGVPAALLIMLIVVCVVVATVQRIRSLPAAQRASLLTAAVGFVVIFLHSMVDFTLSVFYFMGLWVLLACYLTSGKAEQTAQPQKNEEKTPLMQRVGVIIVFGLVGVALFVTMAGVAFHGLSGYELARGNVGQALIYAERAKRLMPGESAVYGRLAEMEVVKYRTSRDSQNLSRAFERVDAGLALAPDSLELMVQKAEMLRFAGRNAEAQEHLEAAIKKAPYQKFLREKWKEFSDK